MIGRRLSARYFRYLTLVKRSHKHLMQHVRATRHFTHLRSSFSSGQHVHVSASKRRHSWCKNYFWSEVFQDINMHTLANQYYLLHPYQPQNKKQKKTYLPKEIITEILPS
ncbi:hypothetical protein TNCT_709201 [Trichonephila clavata]|uniref:Uncharacterized protein n=1 Tax=Trichonephila clavata TaxID=2740835 RepID=A0A8X6F437_TRICU|nr:hypothetical protein TNCT_709201 [Trichonephila clavata]